MHASFIFAPIVPVFNNASPLARTNLGKYFAHEFHEFSCNSWVIIFRGISVAPKTTSSCLKLSPLSSYKNNPILTLVKISATDPVAIPVAHSLRVNSCNSWAKKIFPNNSWAIIFRGISVAPAKDNFKLSQVVPVVVISPPHCISVD